MEGVISTLLSKGGRRRSYKAATTIILIIEVLGPGSVVIEEFPEKFAMGIHQNEKKQKMDHSSTDLERVERNEKCLDGVAEIPEFREQIDVDREYQDFPEEKIWTPQEEVNEWVPFYVFMARSVLTFVQERRGISNREAMENSCTGYAEQYITDVLHDSEYSADTALRTLFTKELPRKLCARWTTTDIELFIKGITKHGKNFSNIRNDLLPEKDTKDLVDFYYAWKWSEPAKKLRNCRHQRRTKGKRRFPSIGCIFGGLASSKIVTRSVAAKLSLESKEESNEAIQNVLLHDITSITNTNEESVDKGSNKIRRHSSKVLSNIESPERRRKLKENSNSVGRKRRRNGIIV